MSIGHESKTNLMYKLLAIRETFPLSSILSLFRGTTDVFPMENINDIGIESDLFRESNNEIPILWSSELLPTLPTAGNYWNVSYRLKDRKEKHEEMIQRQFSMHLLFYWLCKLHMTWVVFNMYLLVFLITKNRVQKWPTQRGCLMDGFL